MGDPVAVSSVPSAQRPAQAATTTVHAVDLVLLRTAAGANIPAFNQGEYRRSELPVHARGGGSRTIQSSGCGMCALTSYLAAAGLQCGGARITPGSFNTYLQEWCARNSVPISQVYAPDGAGALRNTSAALARAINELAGSGAFEAARHSGTWAPGHEVRALTAHLDSGRPAIVGVGINGSAGPLHQVLAVGYARIGTEVYYVINDSGFGPMDGYAPLTGTRAPSRAAVLGRSISTARAHQYTNFYWFLTLSGLEAQTQLTAWRRP